jgi:condensin-2 complex subunit H2
LAQNWNIDVAKDLEEYLDDLDHLEIAIDGTHKLNFAEAALMIQGSACIYSRKVEYLYALIYQALDLLHSKAKRGKVSDTAWRQVLLHFGGDPAYCELV